MTQAVTRKGFTLVELLVVIAIIAILAGLILPALMSSKRMARESQCYSQLREFGNAIGLYKTDYDRFYPSWLSSMLKSEVGNAKAMYVCPLDKSAGTQGGRPDWITAASQYAEANDLDATLAPGTKGAFTGSDKNTASGNLSTYYTSFSITERPTENQRDTDVKACSYLYEYNREWCSWYTGAYPGLSGNQRWQTVKIYEETKLVLGTDNKLIVGSLVPVIRCFWHIDDLGDGDLHDDKPEHQHVVNLRAGFAVNKSATDSWWVQK